MAELSFGDKQSLESWLDMKSGYVLDLSHSSFQELVYDATGLDISDEKYKEKGSSKANLLRAFWRKETNLTVSKLLSALEVYWRLHMKLPLNGHVNLLNKNYLTSLKIIERLRTDLETHIDAIDTNFEDETFTKTKKSIRELIEQNRPDEAIDRLHTYLMMYVHRLLAKHGIVPSNNATLHGLIGLYKSTLLQKGIITVGMTEEIFRVCGALADKFNSVRNNNSLAHANTLLNYQESLFIFKVTASMIEFIESIEG